MPEINLKRSHHCWAHHLIDCEECKDKLPNYHALSNLQRGIDTYKVRNARYGNNYKRFGEIMMALFPKGLTINSVEHWNRMGILHMMIAKMSRYVTDPENGHLDSAHDIGVYSFMLEELDAEAQGFDVNRPASLERTPDVVEKNLVPEELSQEGWSQEAKALCQHIYVYPCAKEHPARQCKSIAPSMDAPVIHSCGKPTCSACGERREP